MRIITKKEARQLQIKKYFTGIPCKRNHVSERWVISGNCCECVRVQQRVKNLSESAKEAKYARTKHWTANNKDKKREYSRKWAKENPDKVKAMAKKCTASNKKAKRKWAKNNRHIINYHAMKRHVSLQRIPQWNNEYVMKQKYKDAQTLTQQTGVKHVVDHIIPLNGKNICGLHVHNNLQVISEKDNLSKYNKFDTVNLV